MSIADVIRHLFGQKPAIRLPRRWPRIVMTDATHMALSSGDRKPVKLANMSAGGARIISSHSLSARDQITLTVPLGAGARMDIPSEVVYCNRETRGLHYALGVRFVAAQREGISRIATFVQEERARRSGAREMWQV